MSNDGGIVGCAPLNVATFAQVALNQRFFNPESGEFWTKRGKHYAICETGGDFVQSEVAEFKQTAPVQFD